MGISEMSSVRLVTSAVVAIFSSSKLLLSAVASILGLVGTVGENLRSLMAHGSVTREEQKEEARITAAIKLLKELEGQNTAESRAARQKLESSLNSMITRLAVLTERGCKLREDPNHELSFVQRLFLLFTPEGTAVFILQSLTYIFMLGVPLGILLSRYLEEKSGVPAEYGADIVVFACYGAVVFRAWALAARKWSYGYEPEPGIIKNLLVLRRPGNGWMANAQIFAWICGFWIVESLEDLGYEIGFPGHGNSSSQNAQLPVIEELIKFCVPLLAAILCGLWAFAELKHVNSPLALKDRFNRSHWPQWAIIPLVSCAALFVAAIVIYYLEPAFFSEKSHQVALVLQSLIAGIACSQWLALQSRRVASTTRKSIRDKAESAAA